ncbi:12248_t:CDS:2 [Funneliformis caledonium]|uniref:12248_t:CDS:1 n=1 Tax=Funneliformis caledonium TaxID=1117310 RepID=A0A9N9HQZ5_9GLOM|nr:12248_t:CDS:2 [Funneliformis caledonium]
MTASTLPIATEFIGLLPKNGIKPYKWNVSAENNSKQRELIIRYLNQHLKPSLPTNIVIYDVANNKSLLDTPVTENSPFPFKLQDGI